MNRVAWIIVMVVGPVCCCLGAALQENFTDPLEQAPAGAREVDFIVLTPPRPPSSPDNSEGDDQASATGPGDANRPERSEGPTPSASAATPSLASPQTSAGPSLTPAPPTVPPGPVSSPLPLPTLAPTPAPTLAAPGPPPPPPTAPPGDDDDDDDDDPRPEPEPPVIELSTAAYRTAESGGPILITVILNKTSPQTVTVDYTSRDDTATAGSDYTGVAGTLIFPPGQTRQSFAVPISDDTLDEPDERLFLLLSNPLNVLLGTVNAASLTILDDDSPPVVQFSAPLYQAAENDNSITITVVLDTASSQLVTVDYASSNETALAGRDYTTATGTLLFAPGQTSRSFAVPITDDPVYELDETLRLTLSNPDRATLGPTNPAVLTIVDDDPTITPSVQFSAPTYSAAEDSGPNVVVTLSNVFPLTVTVLYTTTAITATAGSDYTPVTGAPLIFEPGQISHTLAAPIIADADIECDEDVGLTLGQPVNATLGAPAAAVLTLLNDDDQPTTQVDDLTDNCNCTLREAIITANTDVRRDACPAGMFTAITLAPGNYPLTLTGPGEEEAAAGDLDILADLTLTGAGAGITTIDGSGLGDRIFHIRSGVVTISKLTIADGVAASTMAGPGNGGGIFNAGNLTLTDSELKDSQALGHTNTSSAAGLGGGLGGGLYNTGTLTIRNSRLADNLAQGGRGADGQPFPGSFTTMNAGGGGGGGGGLGGALFNAGGAVTVVASTFADNQAVGGNGGDSAFPEVNHFNYSGGGGGGMGGAGGAASLAGDNGVGLGGGGGGGGGAAAPISNPGGNGEFGGGGGGGGGRTQGGNGGNGGNGGLGAGKGGLARFSGGGGGGGGAGLGGAIFNDGGTVTLSQSSIADNQTIGGAGGAGADGGATDGQDGQGLGGGIFNNGGAINLTGVTLKNNAATAGGAIFVTEGGNSVLINTTLSQNGATRDGGGLFIDATGLDPAVAITHTTFFENTAANSGGGIFAPAGSLPRVANTIIAGSNASGGNCGGGGINSAGHNLISDATCLGVTGTDLSDIDPLLDPLQNNGGSTDTHALQSDSRAIDHILPNMNGCGTIVTTDQRVQSRPTGSGCDIGAYEFP